MTRPAAQFLGWWLLPGIVVSVSPHLRGQALELRWTGDEIRLAAPKLHFLQGKVLERLRDGAPVQMGLQISVAADNRVNILRRVAEKISVSYDLWEEKFAVTTRRSSQPVIHKSAESAEGFCLAQLAVRVSDLPPGRSLWFRLDVRVEEPEDAQASGPPTLRDLVDTFSRTKPKPDQHWSAEAGPVRLEDLKRLAVERKTASL